MKRLCVLLAVLIVVAICGGAFADREEQYTREEAAKRGMKLLTVNEAKAIAAKQLGTDAVRYKDVELEEESDDYPNADMFRPVYKIECYSGSNEYDIVVDAVTGQVLKCKLDD